jgi:S-adenosylmethionine:tRNA ribosyltransferase-isomerase
MKFGLGVNRARKKVIPGGNMDTASDYAFELPPELIAQEPAPRREDARMMVVDRGRNRVDHDQVDNLPKYLNQKDIMVVNDTRVIPARTFGRKLDTGGRVELLFLEEAAPGEWDVLIRASRSPVPGQIVEWAQGEARAVVLDGFGRGRWRVRVEAVRPVLDLLEEHGSTPLPPYIRREGEGDARGTMDRNRYQTVYARHPGAVAAPTAGLHLSEQLLRSLTRAGIQTGTLTLHVGPGTFRPVSTERLEDHAMDEERYLVPVPTSALVTAARGRGGRVLAVGTTCVRALEAAAAGPGQVRSGEGRTDLFIRPPFRVRVVDLLLTNFHLPRSTLLMLVCAFASRDLILEAYREAVRERYRFYSYGDCMLVL